jgi:hypothetical protein
MKPKKKKPGDPLWIAGANDFQKACSKCFVYKDRSEYTRIGKNHHGVQGWCKECYKLHRRKFMVQKKKLCAKSSPILAKAIGKSSQSCIPKGFLNTVKTFLRGIPIIGASIMPKENPLSKSSVNA